MTILFNQYSNVYHNIYHINMKFTIQTILSMPVNGASSHLLIINNKIKILLDCGISHTFDFAKYSKRAQQLQTVSLVLISHSCMEYSGALPFLIDELGMNPKIFYTTQPIMRFSPLNLHEEMVILRINNYNRKSFNRIYRLYESINIVKTQQKKFIDVASQENSNSLSQQQPAHPPPDSMEIEEPECTIGQVDKKIYFTCFSAGGGIGSVCWRISFGLINVLYLVQYNNYSLHHISGLDFYQLKMPIDILITDGYRQIEEEKMKKGNLYEKIKQVVKIFYLSNEMLASKPKPITTNQEQPKLLITCYPNQMLIELMAILKKVFEEIQAPENREKIRVIHLSSRFLQLIKSQIDLFSDFFKDSLQNMEQFYIYSKGVSSRINIVPVYALEGLINDTFTAKSNVTICHLGHPINQKTMQAIRSQATKNLVNFKIMQIQQKIPSSAAIPIQQEKNNEGMEEDAHEKESLSQQMQDYTQMNKSDKQQMEQLLEENDPLVRQPLHGKYFSQIGFPHFIKKAQEEHHNFNEYGIWHEYPRFNDRKTIEEYNREMEGMERGTETLTKKQSTIQVMNIDFKVSDVDQYRPINYSKIKYLGVVPQRTNFSSSVHLMLGLQPKNIIMINTKSDQKIVNSYKEVIKNFGPSSTKFYNLSDKFSTHLQLKNELISYKLNYIPMPTNTKLQKVKGIIEHKNNIIFIHLDCLDGKQCLEFKLHEFYKSLKTKHSQYACKFTLEGIQIEGIKISRQQKQIILEGEYSDDYFKVRKLLYQFIGVM